MLRRLLATLSIAAVAASASVDLNACGDKFVRAGRSQRTRGYASIHPASILIYKPQATAKGLKIFESLLKKAGHKPTALKDSQALAQTLASGKYDLVITDYQDIPVVRSGFTAASGQPRVLPILEQPTKALSDEVAKQYHCVIKIGQMTQYDALDQIDHLMEMRLKGTAVTAASK